MTYLQVFDGTGYRTIVGPPGPGSFPTDVSDDQPRTPGDIRVADTSSFVDWDDDWTNATLLNGWSDYNVSLYAPAGYRRLPGGLISVRGLITTATTNNTSPIFTLGVGYRPAQSIIIATNTAGDLVQRLQITDTGVVYFPYTAVNGWHSLECQFFAD